MPEVITTGQAQPIERLYRTVDSKLAILIGRIRKFPDIQILATLIGQIPLGRIDGVFLANLVENVQTFLLGAANLTREKPLRDRSNGKKMNQGYPYGMKLHGFWISGWRRGCCDFGGLGCRAQGRHGRT